MLPRTLALVDDDQEYSHGLSHHLREQGVAVDAFADSTDLLVHADPYAYEFYVLDLMLPGVDGRDLIGMLRRRTEVGVLVVSGRLGADTFKQVITAGADMYLAKPVQFDQVAIAIEAVSRRTGSSDPARSAWRLDRRVSQLIAPDGSKIDLSEADRVVMECFVEANGEVVPRESLVQSLAQVSSAEASGLNASIFRLRRRIERATPAAVPLETKSGIGYTFRAPLKAF